MVCLYSRLPSESLIFIFWISGELSDPECEERESNDDCCVLVVCSATEESDDEEVDSVGGGEVDRNDLRSQVDSFDVEQEGTSLIPRGSSKCTISN